MPIKCNGLVRKKGYEGHGSARKAKGCVKGTAKGTARAAAFADGGAGKGRKAGRGQTSGQTQRGCSGAGKGI